MRRFFLLLSLITVGWVEAMPPQAPQVEWRWLPGAWVKVPEAEVWQQARPVRLPGVMASRDLAHRWLGSRPDGPLWGSLIGRFRIQEQDGKRQWWLDTGTLAVAARIWMDGHEVARIGRPASNRVEEVPRVLPRVVPLGYLTAGEHRVVVQLSGHHFKEVGLWSPVRLTSAPAETLQLERWAPALVLLGGLGLGLLYLAGLYMREKRPFVRRIVFWLAVFTGALLLRMLMARRLAELVWSAQPAALERYNVWMAVEFSAFFLAMLAWTCVLQAFWRRRGRMLRFLVGVRWLALAAIMMAWLTPPYVYALAGSPMQVFAAGLLLASVRVGMVLWQARPDLRGLWAVSLLALVVPAVHDIALAQFWLSGAPWTEWGLMTVTLCVAWIAIRLPSQYTGTVAGAMPAPDRSTQPAHATPAGNVEQAARRHEDDASRFRTQAQETIQAQEEELALLARQELVALLCRTLALWELHTGRSKAALAEASGAWRVYIDGSTAKTRTLDKYLNVNTLPARPRWRQVVRTALYVRQQCDLPQAEAEELDRLIERAEVYWAGAPVKPVTIS